MIDKDKLPFSLEPVHIRMIMSGSEPMGRRQLYEFLGSVEKQPNPPFPVHRIGRRLKVPRDPFLQWFETGRRAAKQ